MPRSLVVLALAVLAISCGGGSPAPPTVPPSGPETISGSERLGWDQLADDAAELATIGWAVYVDGTRSNLLEVTCSSVAASGRFPCTGRLPGIAAGTHALQLVSFFTAEPSIESARSAPLQVTVRAAALPAPATVPASVPSSRATPSADASRVRVDALPHGVFEPTDAAFAPDGRLFVAGRRGVVSVFGGSPMRTIARSRVDDVSAEAGGGLLAIAIDPEFERTRFVFLVYTAADRTGRAGFRLARFREVQGLLGERAVLLDGVPASPERPSAVLRFGPDRRIYLALDDGGDTRTSADPTSLNGKLLRLTPDGTTPHDQTTPVLWSGVRSPRGLAFAGSSIWLSDVEDERTGRVTSLVLANGRPLRAVADAAYELPAVDTGPLAALPAVGEVSQPSRSDTVWMASVEEEIITRVPPASGGVDERHRVGRARVVLAGPDGALYVCTDTTVARVAVPDR